MREILIDIIKIIAYILVAGVAIAISELSGSDWMFATFIIWLLIILYCVVRFGILKDDPLDK